MLIFFVFAAKFAEFVGEAPGEPLGLAAGAGLDQAGPYAAAGSDCLVASAAMEARAAADVRPGAWRAPCRGRGDGVAGTRNNGRNGKTSALPRRAERGSGRLTAG